MDDFCHRVVEICVIQTQVFTQLGAHVPCVQLRRPHDDHPLLLWHPRRLLQELSGSAAERVQVLFASEVEDFSSPELRLSRLDYLSAELNGVLQLPLAQLVLGHFLECGFFLFGFKTSYFCGICIVVQRSFGISCFQLLGQELAGLLIARGTSEFGYHCVCDGGCVQTSCTEVQHHVAGKPRLQVLE